MSCAGGSAGLCLASRKHSDLREMLLRSPKREDRSEQGSDSAQRR